MNSITIPGLRNNNHGEPPLFPVLNESCGGEPDSVADVFETANEHPTTTKRDKLRQLKSKTKAALKEGVHSAGHAEHGLSAAVTRVTEVVIHPKTALKEKAKGAVGVKVAELNEPYIPRVEEETLVAAHAAKAVAVEEEDVRDAERTIEELERRRTDKKLRTIMEKHVHAVRPVALKRRLFPERQEFLIRDAEGRVLVDEHGIDQLDYLRWAGQLLLYFSQDFSAHYIEDWQPPDKVDIETLKTHTARLLVATAPWQQWLLHIRKVYRWDDPYETFRWLCLYTILWKTSHLVGFVYAYIIFSTLYRYFTPPTSSSITPPTRLEDLISTYSTTDWLSPLLTQLGPSASLQLSDLASILEITHNFYTCTSPRATAYTLTLFSICLLIALLGDMELCMRIVFFILGVIFFFSFPIASRAPQYRHLVSPLRWMLWNIPTDVEWAFMELRCRALETWFAGGKLVVGAAGPRVMGVQRRWEEVEEVRKVKGGGLEFVFDDETAATVGGFGGKAERDTALGALIGHSGRRWQWKA